MASSVLVHYGVIGMKWGVRRTPEQLGHRRASVAKKLKDASKVIQSLSDSDYTDFDQSIDPKFVYDIKVKYDNKTPVGFAIGFRKNRQGKKIVDLSVAVSPSQQGKGLGKTLVQDLIDESLKDVTVDKLEWAAEKDNYQSMQMAETLGFRHAYTVGNYEVYEMNKDEK